MILARVTEKQWKTLNGSTSPRTLPSLPTSLPSLPPHQESKTAFTNSSFITSRKNHAAGYRGNKLEAWGTGWLNHTVPLTLNSKYQNKKNYKWRAVWCSTLTKMAEEERHISPLGSAAGRENTKWQTQPPPSQTEGAFYSHIALGGRGKITEV